MNRPRKALFVLLTALLITAYFTHHIRSGRYGLEAQARLKADLLVVDRQGRSLKSVRSDLKREIALLTTAPPSPDLVEEIARSDLGFAYPGDRIIILRD
ncbi:MAG: septum formation initiator family protein [Pseudomonadota bacterium]